MIPWRVKNFFSEQTPVLYYLMGSLSTRRNTHTNWDQILADSWNDVGRSWPNRCREIQAITDNDQKILDVGCGTGSILRYLKDNAYRNLYGLEHARVAVQRLSDYGISMRQGRLPEIDFPDDYFDVVIASEVLEHILFQKRFLREVKRVLRPGGRAFIFVPNNCMGPIAEPSHVRTYSKTSLSKLLGKFGHVDDVTKTGEDHFAATFLFGILRKPGAAIKTKIPYTSRGQI